MASILFLMRYPLDGGDNLKNKFDGQMAAAEALGHQAYFIGWDRNGMYLCRGGERTFLKRCVLAGMPGYSKTVFYVDLMQAVRKALAIRRFDAAYIRYMRLFHNAPKTFRMLRDSGAKIVMEHPTYPFANGLTTSLLRRPVFWYCDQVFRKIEPLLSLYTLIGAPGGDSLNGIPAMNIVNGVDVDAMPVHQPRREGPVGLLALASMSHWQGYDRLIESLAAYRGEQDVIIHMAGGEGDGSLAAWKKLAQERAVGDQVIFHGEVHGEKLNALAAECDLGVGGLGLYRKKQFQSMTLKLREYMARGLPFVYAVDDPSVPQNEAFCMRLPNDDSAIDMAQIVDFAKQTRQHAQTPALMRTYAMEHMSWQGIFQTVFEKVEIS